MSSKRVTPAQEPKTRTLLLAAALVAAGAPPILSQTRITVVDAANNPVAAVRVDVFGRGELLATVATSSRGVALLDVDDWSRVTRLSLHHIGFTTRIVQADEIPRQGVLRMEPEAVAIQGLEVVGGQLCPVVASKEARAVWAAAAARYSPDTETRAMSARLTRRSGAVRESELYRRPQPADTDDYTLVAWSGGTWHGNDFSSKPLSERTASEGYAWEPIDIGGIRDPGAWRYPDLHAASANHFANPTFGELHDFAIESEVEGVTMLAFCPRRNDDRATIRGVIRVSPNGWLSSADWRFATPDRDEGAGGSAELYAHFEAGDSGPHLVASKGTFFRHSRRPSPYPELPRSYGRRTVLIAGWTVHPSWSHPCRGQESGEARNVRGGGLFRVFPADPRTPTGIAFRECIDRNWGIGPR